MPSLSYGQRAIFPVLNSSGMLFGYLITELLVPITTAIWCFAGAMIFLRRGRATARTDEARVPGASGGAVEAPWVDSIPFHARQIWAKCIQAARTCELAIKADESPANDEWNFALYRSRKPFSGGSASPASSRRSNGAANGWLCTSANSCGSLDAQRRTGRSGASRPGTPSTGRQVSRRARLGVMAIALLDQLTDLAGRTNRPMNASAAVPARSSTCGV